MVEDSIWLEKLPIMACPVNTVRFTSLVNFLYNYSHKEPMQVMAGNMLCELLHALGFITSAIYKKAEITVAGETLLNKIDGHICLNERGQIYIKDYLLAKGFVIPEKVEPQLLPFYLTEEQSNKYEFSDEPLSLLQIIGKINKLIDTKVCRKLTSTVLADFLVDEGMLDVVPIEGGRFYRRATKKGNAEGIFYREKVAGDGNTYFVNLYDKNAQFFIIDNMKTIALFASGEKKIRDSRLNEVSSDEPEVVDNSAKYTCKDCMDYRNGNCFGANAICEDFRFAYTYSAKEVENWPTEGAATYFRRKGKIRS